MLPLEPLRDYYLPVVRAAVASELSKRGWGQRAVARALGVTQVAVSKALKRTDVVKKTAALGVDGLELELLVGAVVGLVERGREEAATALVARHWLLLAASGAACSLHRSSGWLLAGCQACARALHPALPPPRAAALADLERALVLVEASKHLVLVAPEVMVNVVRAAAGAVSTEDVAAVPGRVARVGSRLVARGRPKFGASRHLAEVLLASGYSACINVKYGEGVARALEELEIGYAAFSSEDYRGPNPAAAAVVELKSRAPLPRVVIDTGGRGIEPIAYVFGRSAVEAVLTAERIARLAAPSALAPA